MPRPSKDIGATQFSALRYYRALRDGTDSALATEVGGRILADEQRHVPFHTQRLRDGFGHLPRTARSALAAAWWVLMLGATCVVAVDHGPALRALGVRRIWFVVDCAGLFRPVVAMVFHGAPLPADLPASARVPQSSVSEG
jgi:hypothetical protein